MADAVLGYAGYAQEGEERYGIPRAVLMGLISVESHGDETAVSPAGAFGATQFMPGTAASYGVKRGDKRSQVLGAARYLKELGFASNPRLALKKYNAGPGAPQNAGNYDSLVLNAAKKYGNLKVKATKGASPTASGGGGGGGGGIFDGLEEPALRALLWITFAIGGAALVGMGIARTAGIHNPGDVLHAATGGS